MREAKQRRLAAKGWKTGDAKDFLGLSVRKQSVANMSFSRHVFAM